MSLIGVLKGPAPRDYASHWLHSAPDLAWPVSNCYADMWIETLNWLGHNPVPALAAALAIDFEGDQWTLFKPLPGDLHRLYGIDVCELNIWRPLREQLAEQLALGRLVATEADAFWLPDTAGTAYRTRHQKTTVCITAVDPAARRLR